MDKSLKEKLLESMKIRGVKVPKLSRETGIPADRIYKWFQQGTNPKEEDSLILEKWIIGQSEKSNTVKSDSEAVYGHDFSTLVKAHLLLVESNSRLSVAHERLSQKIELTAHVIEEKFLVAAGQFDALVDLLREQALKFGLYRSERDFQETYRRKVNEYVKKRKEVRIGGGSGKSRKVES